MYTCVYVYMCLYTRVYPPGSPRRSRPGAPGVLRGAAGAGRGRPSRGGARPGAP